jgi:uncharacterized protein GlcG (DUF336 family)
MKEIEILIESIEKLIPEYMANAIDKNITGGNLAVCIIDEENNVYGKLIGPDKNKSRQSYKNAWTKASQVWITGYKTSEYETLVFTKQIDESKFGISRPDLIGWEGGQPVTLKDGTKLSIGFSGFRGTTDLEIVVRAIKLANL